MIVDAEALEGKARILAGYDAGNAAPLSDEERNEMLSWASDDLGYPAHDAPLDDKGIARWSPTKRTAASAAFRSCVAPSPRRRTHEPLDERTAPPYGRIKTAMADR